MDNTKKIRANFLMSRADFLKKHLLSKEIQQRFTIYSNDTHTKLTNTHKQKTNDDRANKTTVSRNLNSNILLASLPIPVHFLKVCFVTNNKYSLTNLKSS